jgi:hypothetical protein
MEKTGVGFSASFSEPGFARDFAQVCVPAKGVA